MTGVQTCALPIFASISSLAQSYERVRTAKIAYESSQAPAYLTELENRYNQLKADFESFLTYYQNSVGIDSGNRLTSEKIHVLTTSTLHLSTKSFIQKCIDAFDMAETTEDKYSFIITQIGQNYKFKDTLTNYVESLIPFIPNADYVKTLQEYIVMVEKRLGIKRDGLTYTEDLQANGLYQEIARFVDSVKTSPEKNASQENLETLKVLATR